MNLKKACCSKHFGISYDLLKLSSVILLAAINPVAAEEIENPSRATTPIKENRDHVSTSAKVLVAQEVPKPEVEQPATPVDEWQRQIAQSPTQVTGVRLNPTDQGVEVILETPSEQKPRTFETRYGETLAIDVINTQLRLSEEFRQENPTPGIASVEVVQRYPNSIRVIVTGTEAVPTAEVVPSPKGVALSVTSPSATAEQPLTPEAEPSASTEEPGTESSAPTAPETEDQEPVELVVTAGQDTGYRVERATTATRTDTPIRDIPASIQVVPQEVIRDQGATSIRETLRNVSGVTFSNAAGNRAENFNIRGFSANEFQNGFREDPFSRRTQRDLANIERVEVLKGPASVLFGRAEPSGIINYVTKQPLLEPFYDFSFTAGSFDFYRPTIDLSSPLTEDRRLAYRLNLAYENAGSFRDFVDTERFFIAPTLAYQFSDDTRLALEVSHLDDARPVDRGLVVLSNDQIADIPTSRLLGGAEDVQFSETRTVLSFEHRFNPNLSLRSAFRYTNASEEGPQLQIGGSSSDDRTFPLFESRIPDDQRETYTFQNELIAEFNTGSVEHTVLLGLELARQEFISSAIRRSAGTIDILDPDFNFAFGEPSPLREFEQQIDLLGIYLQDQISLLDNLILVLGGRFDSFSQEGLSVGNPFEVDASAFSPRAGLVYQPTSNISLYGNYSRSFTPVRGSDVNNEPFDPERGTGYEVGIKTDFFDNRLSSTLAFFNTTLSNISTTDPDNPGFSIQVGEQRSRGIELDIAGEILPGWNLIATYAYIDAEITEDNRFEVGNRLVNVPDHSASLWTTYEIQQGSLAGLGFGAGIFFVGNRQGDLNNSFEVPSYTRTDAAIYYTRYNLRAALNFKNLFDIRYFEGSQNRNSVTPGAPFTVLGSLSWQF